MSTPGKIVIRADAGPTMGTGHVMRCLALAQAAIRQGMHVVMVCRVNVAWVRERLGKEGIQHIFLPDTAPEKEVPTDLLAQVALAEATGGDWVCLDGYHFDADCQKAVRAKGYSLLVIDDYAHLPEYHCDILLNQNIGAEELHYAGNIEKKLIGPQYAILRPEFAAARAEANQRSFPIVARNILISLGGGDFSSDLEQLVPIFHISELAGSTIKILAGSMSAEKIHALFEGCAASFEILSRIDDMARLLLWADLCITAGGSTCWELCCLGVPFLTVAVAENQEKIVTVLDRDGVSPQLSSHTLATCILSPAARKSMSHSGQKLVNGFGASRVVTALCGHQLSLRRVEQEDSLLVFTLANDPFVRAASFSPQKITKEEHHCWFSKRIAKTDSPFYLAYIESSFAGYIRFDKTAPGTATIAIAVSPEQRGKKVGTKLIYEGCSLALQKGFTTIEAWVLPENIPSQKAFVSAGFVFCGEHEINNIKALLFCFPNINRGNHVQ